MQIDREAIAKLMLSSDNGSAPGPSGWGSNMLSILADDPESVQSWTNEDAFASFFRTKLNSNKLSMC